jgi:hypothetical protein
MRVHFDLHGLGRLIRQLTRASNSLAVAIVIAGLFIASAQVLAHGPAPLAYTGFIVAVVLGLWLVWNMSRS